MHAIFSCAAYQNFDQVKELCLKAEIEVNRKLKGKVYDGIRFLNPQFSFTAFVNDSPPSIDNNTLSLVVSVDQDDLPHMADALIRGLNDPIVPLDLMEDLRHIFQNRGWL